MRRISLLVPVLLFAGCASQPERLPGQVEILSSSRGQALSGALCTVSTAAGQWTVETPASLNVGEPRGDLRVVCQREGYRTSEVLIRGGSGAYGPGSSRVGIGMAGGSGYRSGVGLSLGFGFPIGTSRPRYPAQVVVDMAPLTPSQ